MLEKREAGAPRPIGVTLACSSVGYGLVERPGQARILNICSSTAENISFAYVSKQLGSVTAPRSRMGHQIKTRLRRRLEHFNPPRLVLGAFVTIEVIASAAAGRIEGGAGTRSAQHLILEEVAAVQVPSGESVTGGALGADDVWAAWSSEQPGLIVPINESVQRVCADVQPLAGGFRYDGDRLQVLDRAGETWELGADHRCHSRGRAKFTGEMVGAALVGDAWIVATVDLRGRSELSLLENGRVADLVRGDAAIARQLRLRQATIAPISGGVIIASLRWPFSWVVIDKLGRRINAGYPFERDSVLTTAPDTLHAAMLLGLAVQALDTGFIQVLSDPWSSTRAFAIYDQAGRVSRVAIVRTSLGVLATLPAQRRLMMLRRTDVLEVVTYRWRWGERS